MFNSILESNIPTNLHYLEPLHRLNSNQIKYIDSHLLLPKSFIGIKVKSKAAEVQLSISEGIKLDMLESSEYDNHAFYLLARRLYCSNEYIHSKKYLSKVINSSHDFSDELSIKSLVLYIYCCIELKDFQEAYNLIFNLSNSFKSLLDSKFFVFSCCILFCELLHHDFDQYSHHEDFIELTLLNALREI